MFGNHVDNERRADWAGIAIESFCQETFCGRSFVELLDCKADDASVDDSDAADAIADLITDLLHLARRHEIDPEQCVTRGKWNFEEEEEEARNPNETEDMPF